MKDVMLLQAALSYANRGWHVFPLQPRSKVPATHHGVKDATTDVDRIQNWWTDIRAAAALSLMLFGGLRVSDVAGLEIDDVVISERSGQLTCRRGKGNKQRIVPLPLEARRALSKYMESRPPSESNAVFVGERGPLTEDGIRAICSRYAACSGVSFTPHTLRHTFAHRFLDQGGDIASLAQILGHENLNTTAIYTKRSQEELARMSENLRYE